MNHMQPVRLTVPDLDAGDQRQRKEAFVSLPHDVALDARLSADALTVLAYRATFVNFFMQPRLLRRRLGMGKDRAYAAFAGLKELGYLQREQVRIRGDFGQGRERLDFTVATPRRPGYKIHPRSLFERGLSSNAVALYLFVAAFAASFALYATQIQARFGWSSKTVGRYARELIEAGLIARVQRRSKHARFIGVAYVCCGHLGPQTQKRQTQKPETPKPEPYLDEKITKQQSSTTLSQVDVITSACSGSEVGSPDEVITELRSHDHAKVLAPRLLTRGGIEPYLAMLRDHGDVARRVVTHALAKAMIDGARPGKIQSWGYFARAIEDEQRDEHMAQQGFRPGDVYSSWRDGALEPPF